MEQAIKIVSALGLVFVEAGSLAMTDEEKREVTYASEAAPKHITDAATFLMFRDGTFQTIKEGSNNFTCLVLRNPNERFEPACLNKSAVESVLPTYEYHTARLYAGASEQQVMDEIGKKFESGELPTAKTGSLVYMMSQNNRAYREDIKELISFPPHQMYFMSRLPDDVFSLENSTFTPGSPFVFQAYPHMTSLIIFTK
ncbi:chromate transporter [uncultured Gilvimarinus sp.]|uniref:chromate transporter n=1 Tax=uncultured Gilvimarinus sp. TaxID=1689143 RepID=UPI0030DC1130